MFLIGALVLFVVFLANVLVGTFGGTQFLGDVGEMLLLYGASLAFVVAILQHEAAMKEDETNL